MTTYHHWFRSGDYQLLGHTDVPENRGEAGVVIVPPFGFEDACSHRALRHVAGMLAGNGMPVLRFDLPGSGDSSGSPLDTGLMDAWVASISAAAAELRNVGGVRRVAVFGVHMGATLALIAAAGGAEVDDLALWGPVTTGRSTLRELRAYARMQRAEDPGDRAPVEPPFAGLEVAGFLLTPETQQALEEIDLSALPAMPGRRVLLLSRDNYPPEAKLVSALEAGGSAVTVQTGEGYAAMMSAPHDSVPPLATGRRVVEFLVGTCANDAPPPSRSSVEGSPVLVDGTSESVFTLPEAPALFGVISEPPSRAPHTGLCVLLLNPGAVRHIGPNRMWVEAARRWAARGVTSVRLDLPGIGESDGERNTGVEGLYQLELVDHVERAMGALAIRLGHPKFAVAGLCSGAFWAFHAAIRNPDIRAAILLNPRLFFWDPEVDRRRVLRRTAKGLTDVTDWRRLLRGRVCRERFTQIADAALAMIRSAGKAHSKALQIPAKRMARAWAALERNKTRMTMIFGENEPLLAEMEEEGQLPPQSNPLLRCVKVPYRDHTFSQLNAQTTVHELLDLEIEAVLGDGAPASVYESAGPTLRR